MREVDMGCLHANGLHVTCKAVIMVAPSLEWQSASIADVSGEVRVASHNAVLEKPTGFTQGHPGVREGCILREGESGMTLHFLSRLRKSQNRLDPDLLGWCTMCI